MKVSPPNLVTPIYLKLSADWAWPAHESVFYLLSGQGLFLCRNNQFFRSSVPIKAWPAELAPHHASLRLQYPKIPQRLLERIIGFFDRIGTRHGAEAAALFVWNKRTETMEAIVPPQRSIVSRGWNGDPYPIEMFYDVPPLPPDVVLIGDIHSHVDGPAYSSFTDREDERHRPGLHIVVGRIQREPPQFHIEVTIDGSRFEIHDRDSVFAGYQKRRPHEVPPSWIDAVTVQTWTSKSSQVNSYEYRPSSAISSCHSSSVTATDAAPSTRPGSANDYEDDRSK